MSFLAPHPDAVRRRRLLTAGLAVLMTVIVMTAFMLESRWGYLPPDPVVVFAQSWTGDRSRADTLADRAATDAARAALLAESRAHIATLPAAERIKAQEQYDAYVAGGGAAVDIPYVAAAR